MPRRLIGLLVLTAVLAAAASSHHHAVFVPDSHELSEEVVTTHDPLSSASHWHAIVRIVALDPCWACHCSRLFDLPRPGAVSSVCLVSGRWNGLPPRSALSVARFTRRSRAPPTLL